MIRRHAGVIAIAISLFAGSVSAQQNVDAAIAARAGDAALKDCLDKSPAVVDYRRAVLAVSRARDPKVPAKFNCSGIGANWQEVAPKACCVAFERDKSKNVDAAWTALQVCGWQATTVQRRPGYEAAANRCLAQTTAKPSTPPQQAQKPAAPPPTQKSPTAQQQAQKPQPAPPSHPTQETYRLPPTYPPSFPPQQAQVPLTPPPPIPVPPSGPVQQTQVPPPPPPVPPVQQTQVPTSDPAAVKALVTHLQLTAVDAWKERPTLKDEAKNLKVPGLLVFKDASGEIKCEEKGGVGPLKYFHKPRKLRYRLIDNRDTVLRAILNFGYSDAEANAIADALKLDESKIPPEIRNRSYALWDGMDLYHFLYGTMLLFGTREPAALKVPVAWDPWCPEEAHASSEHSSVRGTINGGGDFINYRPKAASPSLPLLHLIGGVVPQRAPVPRGYSSVAGEKTTIRVPGGRVQVPDTSLAAIDVAPNGVTAVAAMAGTVRVSESATGIVRDIAQGNLAVIIPGKGVSVDVPLPVDTHKKLAEMRREAEASRRIAQAPSPIRLSDATPARGVKDGKPVEPGAVFSPDVNPIYVWFRLDGVTAVTKLRQVWYYLGTGADRTIGGGEFTAPAGSRWADVKYTLDAGKRWLLGEYRVEIYAGDKRLAEVPFRVADAGAQPRIVEARAAHGVRDGKPVQPTETFKPDTKEVFVWFRVAGIRAATKLRAVWNYIGAAGEQFIVESGTILTPEVEWGDVRVEQAPGRPWPVGAYRVDLLLGDVKVMSVPFRVVGAAAPVIVAAMPARGVKDGEPVSPGEVFAPDAGKIYIWFRMAGHNAPTTLRGVWHYLGAGSDQVIISSEVIMQANQDWGDFQLELPPGRPWPKGEYRLDILIAGQQAAAVPFRVADAAAQPALAAPRIVEAKPARGVKDGRPVDPGDVLTQDRSPIYIWFRIAGHDRPVKLLSEWHYLGTGRDELLADIEMTDHPGKEGGHFQLELQPGRLWPLGEYRVDILIDGKVAASVPFRVRAPAVQPKIVEAKPARDVKDGKLVDPRDVFTPDMNPIYIWFRIAGNTAPTEMRSVWHYLGGGGDDASEADGGTLPAGRETGYFGKELPPGTSWRLGEYRVDIMIGNTKAASVPFRVEAAPGPAISQVQAARGVKEGKPVDAGTVFATDPGPIYIWFRMTGHKEPTKVRAVWRYKDFRGSERIIKEIEGTMAPTAGSGNFRLAPNTGQSWNAGAYRVDIMIGEKVGGSVSFLIKEGPASPAAKAPAVPPGPSATPAPAAPAAGGVTIENIEALLRELGFQPLLDTRKDGVPYFRFLVDGRHTVLAMYDCRPGPCSQLLLHTGFKTPSPVSQQTINDWNRGRRMVHAYLGDDGDPVVESDQMVTGARIETVREWIAMWRQQLPRFVNHITERLG